MGGGNSVEDKHLFEEGISENRKSDRDLSAEHMIKNKSKLKVTEN